MLRGISGLSELYAVSEFHTCESLLENFSADSLIALGCFRSDEDLVKVLDFTTQWISQGKNGDLVGKILQSLKEVQSPSSSTSVRDSYLRLMKLLVESRSSDNLSLRYASSSVVSLTIDLIGVSVFNEELRSYLMKFLDSSDRRIVSNALDALTHFDPRHRDELLNHLSEHPDNRVRANAFIKQGLVALDNQVIVGLRQMLHDPTALTQASGCYAVGELARYYRSEDLPFYETHLPLKSLLRRVQELSKNDNDMVRRQAEAALAKAGTQKNQFDSGKLSKKAAA